MDINDCAGIERVDYEECYQQIERELHVEEDLSELLRGLPEYMTVKGHL